MKKSWQRCVDTLGRLWPPLLATHTRMDTSWMKLVCTTWCCRVWLKHLLAGTAMGLLRCTLTGLC